MKSLLVLLLFGVPALVLAKADFYRLSWRSDPATSMTICWNQISGVDPEICYDTVDRGPITSAYRFRQKPDRVVEYRGMSNHFARLENLKPDTAYHFIVRDSEGVGRQLWFRTAPAKPKPFTFIAGGDSRTNPEPRREGNKLVAKLRPLFILFGGDYSGSGTAEQWHAWFTDWQLTISEDGRIYPIIATHGNHENADMQMMDKLFDTPHPDQYYSLGIGGPMMRIWVLNSELEYREPGKVREQQAWIKADLPRHANAIWKIVAYHRPMRAHTAAKAEGESRIASWAKLFHDHRVDLVVESDTHMVKRSYPLRPDNGKDSFENFIRDDKTGTVFIGEGSWGAPKRPVNDDKPWTMASASFHQFKWIMASPKEMHIRTVQFENVDAVSPLTENNLFEEPGNMVFWEPESGKILRLPFDPAHPSYNEPVPPKVILGLGEIWSWSLDGQSWTDAPAPLGYGDKVVKSPIAPKEAKPRSAFFRKEFSLDDPSSVTRLFFDVQADDGCIIKLNGKVVIRHNMPAGKVTSDTRATATVSKWAEQKAFPRPVDPKFLKAGVNLIEAQVHQASAASSDLIFDMAVRVKE